MIALFLLAACGSPGPAPSAAERRMALDMANLRVRLSMNPCIDQRGAMSVPRRLRDCLTLGPGERIRGVWYQGLEQSAFREGATSASARRIIDLEHMPPEFDTHLDVQGVPPLWNFILEQQGRTKAIAVEFVGRRTTGEDSGIAEFRHVIVMDRLISARVLGPVEDLYDCRIFRRAPRGTPCAPGTEGGRGRWND